MPSSSFEVLLQPAKKLYFASDFHLGAPNHADSLQRERKIVAWLDAIKTDAQVVLMVGDLFDFWFEYRRVVPRGFVRLLAKIGELTEAGVEVVIFKGNHDLWMSDYFEQEIGAKIYRKPLCCTVQSSTQTTSLYVAHGDGLGPGDFLYKILKRVFENGLARWAFAHLLPADVAMWLAHAWARSSWQSHEREAKPVFLGENKEWLLLHAKAVETEQHHDFYVFGHRHIVLDYPVAAGSRMLILGDWITHFTYAVFDGQEMELRSFNV